MTDFELFQNKAELEKLGLSEIPADVAEADTENESVIFVPVSRAGAGIEGSAPVKAEVMEEEDSPAAVKAAGYPAPLSPIGMPCLPSSLSAQTLFNLALTVEAPDPARRKLGYFYESQLMRECAMLIPHPIPSYYLIGIRNALMIRRRNPVFFICYAIDVVLTYYSNHFSPEDNDVFS